MDEKRPTRKTTTIKRQVQEEEIIFILQTHIHEIGQKWTQKKPPGGSSFLHHLVPKAGLEPARISTVDFESTASTDFATSALKRYAENVVDYTCHTPPCKHEHTPVSLSAENFSIVEY